MCVFVERRSSSRPKGVNRKFFLQTFIVYSLNKQTLQFTICKIIYTQKK